MTWHRADYLDGCWRNGYAAYERGRLRPSGLDQEARKAWQKGWDKAKYEYEELPADE